MSQDAEIHPGTDRGSLLAVIADHTPLLIIGYFLLQAALRAVTPGGLGLDEAEIVITTQSLQWGYGPQPPLYTYLQSLFFALFGQTKLALALLKNTFLAGTVLSLYAAARLAGASRNVAAMAGLSIMLLPQFSWESQRDLTHTVLAVAIGAACLPVFLRICTHGRWADYALLGGLAAAGMLSKYNFAFFAAGLYAVLVIRPASNRWRIVLSVMIAVCLLAPFVAWAFLNPDLASQRMDKFDLGGEGPIMVRLQSLSAFLQALMGYLALPAVIFLALFWRRNGDATPENAKSDGIELALLRDLQWALAISAVLVSFIIIGSGATTVKDRWLHPVLFALPFILTLLMTGRWTARHLRWGYGIVGVIALATMIVAPLDKTIGSDKPPRQAAPIAPLAARIASDGTAVLADSNWLGGNLRYAEPDLKVLTPAIPHLPLNADGGRVQLIWNGRKGAEPPEDLISLYKSRFGTTPDLSQSESLSAPYEWPHKGSYELRRAIATPSGAL